MAEIFVALIRAPQVRVRGHRVLRLFKIAGPVLVRLRCGGHANRLSHAAC
jgi:hypothetical protein